MTRAPQCRGDALIEHPADCQVNNALAETLLGDPIELLNGGHILSEPWPDELWVSASQIVAAEDRACLHSSGQQAAAQRAISQRRNVIFSTIGQKVRLDSTFEQIVRRLQHMKR